MRVTTYAREEHNYAIKFTFKTTNNEVEYETLLVGLSVTESLGATEVEVRVDSQIVINQVLGEFNTKGEKLKKYLQLVWKRGNHLWYFHIQQVPRGEN